LRLLVVVLKLFRHTSRWFKAGCNLFLTYQDQLGAEKLFSTLYTSFCLNKKYLEESKGF
jgi:hypothetical protein